VKVLIDACALVPAASRAMLLAAAAAGAFAPLWSAGILEEWALVSRRRGPEAEAAARAAIAGLRAAWPDAEVAAAPDLEATLALPDPGDRHVLAAAIVGRADVLATRNRGDFPGRTLARHGIVLRDPDGLLVELVRDGLDLGPAAEAARARAEAAAGRPLALRPLLKRAGLPRLGKALGGGSDITIKT
jgi:catechol 2,3-dioxygenase-like lactoylglutathione lyase family enzyme